MAADRLKHCVDQAFVAKTELDRCASNLQAAAGFFFRSTCLAAHNNEAAQYVRMALTALESALAYLGQLRDISSLRKRTLTWLLMIKCLDLGISEDRVEKAGHYRFKWIRLS
ncbi:hypothetical protein E2562_012664 [Oryza meyeriana var. granulata]|uniref:Uncharacterized protein n=1 Tax=Oryza meyeriana var. granulata TaxID=110450 RepID=A0A6G1CEQ5_9ORYZ|nr:hypothetical protein E2562_012664 [Oryza meyeriana var. granulata]